MNRYVTVERRCERCGMPFQTQRARFCSDACRQGAHRDRQAKLLAKRGARRDRETALRLKRQQAEEAARDVLRNADICHVECADVRTWRPVGVDAIISDPPYYAGDAIALYSELADFAVDVLPPGGALVAMTDIPRLPEVLEAMQRPRLHYRGIVCWEYADLPLARDWQRRLFPTWKPVLVYYLDGWPDDVPWVPLTVRANTPDRSRHRFSRM